MSKDTRPATQRSASKQHNVPKNAALRNILLNLIETDLKHAKQLEEILENIKLTLGERQVKTLHSLIESQQPVLAAMHQTAQRRTEILQKMGLEDKPDDWQKVLDKFTLNDAWQPLQQTLTRCKNLNEINQRVITRNRQSVGRLIDIFRGEYGQPTLYNAEGDTRSKGARGRTISTA